MADLLSILPPETHNQIYSLVLSHNPVAITYPRRRHSCTVSQRESGNFAALSRVNKQFHAEATSFFYTRNIFLLSNNSWASPHFSDFSALQLFVSKNKLALKLFRNVVLEMKAGPILSDGHCNLDDMKRVAQLLAKHFSGVTSVRFKIRYSEHWIRNWRTDQFPGGERIAEEERQKGRVAKVVRVVRVVLQMGGLREVRWLEEQKSVFGKLEGLVGKVTKERGVKDNEKVKVMSEKVVEREEPRCDYWSQDRPYRLK